MVKEVSSPFLIIGSLSVSAANTYTSSASSILYRDSVCYQVNAAGVPTGSLNINGSADYNPGTPQSTGTLNAGNWTTITTQAIGSGTSYPVLFNLNQLAMPWTQFQFVSSTNTGTISVYVSAKSLG